MMMLMAVPSTQPDYVALAMVLVLVVIVAIMAIRKRVSRKPKEEAVTVEPIPEA